MAELTIPQTSAPKRHPGEIAIDRIWRFFCSVRAAIWEVSVLALMVLIGTLRGSSVPNSIAELLPVTAPLVDRWYAYDVFRSLPFAGLLALLSVAIAICTINRVPGIWSSITNPTVLTSRGFIASADVSASLTPSKGQEDVPARLRTHLEARRYRVIEQELNGDTHLYADKNRFGKLGTFPFHLALIMILVGGIVGARYGFRDDEFIVAEGATERLGHGTSLSVRLEDFQDSYNQLGAPLEYRSDLVLYDGDREVKRQSITVNHPMTYDSVVFYQTSFGPAVSLIVTDPAGTVVYDGTVPLGRYTAKENPDAPAGVLDLPHIGQRLIVVGPDANPGIAPEKDRLKLLSGELHLQLRDTSSASSTPELTGNVAIGQRATLGDYTVTFVRDRQWTMLQVASNPGIPIFWAAAFMMIGGLGIVFYFPHRRIRGIVSSSSGPQQIQLAALAKRDWSAKRSFEQLIEEMERELPVAARIVRRDGDERERPTPLASA